MEPLNQSLLLSNEISELVVGEACSASVAVVLDAVNCINVRRDVHSRGTIVGKRIGRNVGGAAAMWVPAKM